MGIIQKQKFGQFDRPSRYVDDLPIWLEEIVCQLLEKDPVVVANDEPLGSDFLIYGWNCYQIFFLSTPLIFLVCIFTYCFLKVFLFFF